MRGDDVSAGRSVLRTERLVRTTRRTAGCLVLRDQVRSGLIRLFDRAHALRLGLGRRVLVQSMLGRRRLRGGGLAGRGLAGRGLGWRRGRGGRSGLGDGGGRWCRSLELVWTVASSGRGSRDGVRGAHVAVKARGIVEGRHPSPGQGGGRREAHGVAGEAQTWGDGSAGAGGGGVGYGAGHGAGPQALS